jgi:hypothetical protein
MTIITNCSTLNVVTEGSEDGKLRFTLQKTWDSNKNKALFVLINPSKGTALKLDNTICNITNIAVDNDFGCFRLVNLFPYMATNPKELSGKLDFGKEQNTIALRDSFNWADVIYIAWGTSKNHITRKREVEMLLSEFISQKPILCWKGMNGSYPRHLRIIEDNWELESYIPMFIKNT